MKNKDVSNLIKELRKKLDLTQGQFAQLEMADKIGLKNIKNI